MVDQMREAVRGQHAAPNTNWCRMRFVSPYQRSLVKALRALNYSKINQKVRMLYNDISEDNKDDYEMRERDLDLLLSPSV
eukprot:TRINITY_DN13139_c0_g1_i1.p2 TRINITY_DN13139_c0_g1~~TRINITY_DN13139_c0_g1_i1.p2  ORF type:complete len:80 (+),score=5.65 TRINITY_DN13139_c0_g1_i1:142-381(+)